MTSRRLSSLQLAFRFLASRTVPPNFAGDNVERNDDSRRYERRVKTCLNLIANRHLVGRHIGFDLCADPAWDMLLDLYISECRGRNIAISSLASAANVPPTTARSAIRILRKRGWVSREADTLDGRRIYIRLTEMARSALVEIFDAIADRADTGL